MYYRVIFALMLTLACLPEAACGQVYIWSGYGREPGISFSVNERDGRTTGAARAGTGMYLMAVHDKPGFGAVASMPANNKMDKGATYWTSGHASEEEAIANLQAQIARDGMLARPSIQVYHNTNEWPLQPDGAYGCSKPANLQHWWRGDGNAEDAIGGRNGTFSRRAGTAAGFIDKAFSLNGIDDQILLPGDFGGTSELTVAAWFKAGLDRSKVQAIIGSTTPGLFRVEMGDQGNSKVYTDTGPLSLPLVPFQPSDRWNHVVLVVKSGDIRLYLNGGVIGASTQTFGSILPTSSLRIGASLDGERTFGGYIDEVAMFDRALSPREARQLLLADRAGICQ